MDHSGCRKALLSGGQVPLAGVAAVLCWVKSTLSCKKALFDLPSTTASSTCLGKSSRTKLASSDNSLIDSSMCCSAQFTGQSGYLCKRPRGAFFHINVAQTCLSKGNFQLLLCLRVGSTTFKPTKCDGATLEVFMFVFFFNLWQFVVAVFICH